MISHSGLMPTGMPAIRAMRILRPGNTRTLPGRTGRFIGGLSVGRGEKLRTGVTRSVSGGESRLGVSVASTDVRAGRGPMDPLVVRGSVAGTHLIRGDSP